MKRILLLVSILPIVLLLIFIYQQDRFQKEPVKTLSKAFLGGLLVIPLSLAMVILINQIWVSPTFFYSAFWEAGIPEELSKFLIFMLLIWRDRNFDEYFDGIVYATFIGLGFACVENIMYVYSSAKFSFGNGLWTGFARAILSVPAHFLFGVIMGYFFSMAKFNKKGKRTVFLLTGLLLSIGCHGLFDWLLMVAGTLDNALACIIYIAFIAGDIFLWRIGVNYIRELQQESLIQSGKAPDDFSEYHHIDWNAGNRHKHRK